MIACVGERAWRCVACVARTLHVPCEFVTQRRSRTLSLPEAEINAILSKQRAVFAVDQSAVKKACVAARLVASC